MGTWTAELHPRARKGTTTGGKFVNQGDNGTPKGTISYDPKTGKGTGYGIRGGDRKVRTLQMALNRLGITDSRGRPLAVDGKLGPLTTSAVKDLQRRLGVKADGMVTPALLSQIKNLKTAPPKRVRRKRATASEETDMADRTTDAVIDGERTFDEVRDLVRDALAARVQQGTGQMYVYCYIADLTASQVVYSCEGADDLMQCSYEIGADDAVTLGIPVEVVRTYAPAPTTAEPAGEDMPAMEAVADRTEARVLEAKGTDPDGGRVFRVRIIAYGTSKNRRRYTESVMRKAAPLYEGAKAFDHHRTDEELRTSTISGLVGHYRNVEAAADGLYGDLHLLPSATHAAETLDAAIAAQAAGLEPPVGISHDVQATFVPVVEGGQRVQEATQIVSVDSADIVAKPSAGGKAVRAVAGGDPTETEETDVPDKAAILAAFSEATEAELAAIGLVRTAKTTESTVPAVQRAVETTETVREATHTKTSALGKLLIKQAVTDAGLPEAVVESLTGQLSDRFTEGDIETAIAGVKSLWATVERAGLAPTVGNVEVTKESQEKKADALDKFFAGDYVNGYRSFQEAYLDWTGNHRYARGVDLNRRIMRESIGKEAFDSGERATESLIASSWNYALGDSITRRMIALYQNQDFQTWRPIVSSIVPVNDFRTQRIDRVGGYGTLPTVAEGGPYNPLTSPSNEEVTYAITKKGGTEDLTLEMIANDDVRAISNIPRLLGVAAANTLYRFVWDMIVTNANIYDGNGLFTTGHANYVNSGSGSALTQSSLSSARILMTSQTAYGDTSNFIAPTPRFLVYVNDIEEIALQLCTSAVAIPSTPAGPSNTPNIHQGYIPIRLDYPSSTTAWWVIADPNVIPTIEVGFYQGRQEPELFTQSDPSVGSMFNADTLTYKIRHIYSGAVLDYRGMVKGN